MQEYEVMIDGEIMPRTMTYREMSDYGMLRNVDERIKIRKVGNTRWFVAATYHFSDAQRGCGYHINPDGTVTQDDYQGRHYEEGDDDYEDTGNNDSSSIPSWLKVAGVAAAVVAGIFGIRWFND